MGTKPRGGSNVRAVAGPPGAISAQRTRPVESPVPKTRKIVSLRSRTRRLAPSAEPASTWRPNDLLELASTWTSGDLPMVSVILGTYNRKDLLVPSIESFRRSVGPLSYEIVVADGGSRDGSRQWLSEQSDVVLVSDELKGAVRAFNKAYAASRGKYVALLNDDIVSVDDALLLAVGKLETDRTVGQVACSWGGSGKPFIFETVHGFYYANLGVMPRWLCDIVVSITGGLWSPCYYTYGADTELSCWIYRLGMKVCAIDNARFENKPLFDDLRKKNMRRARADNYTFHHRWPSPDMLDPEGAPPRVGRRELAVLARTTEEAMSGAVQSWEARYGS